MGEVPCPRCDTLAPVEDNDANSLPTVVFINRLINYCKAVNNTEGSGEGIDCEKCHEAKATAFCQTISTGSGSFVCESCTDQMNSDKESDYQIIPLSELKQGVLLHDKALQHTIYSCKLHDDAPRDLYCFKCSQLICSECADEEHRGHHYDTVKTIADPFKTEVLRSLDPLREFHAENTSTITDIEQAELEIIEQGDEISKTLESSFNELIAIIEDRKRVLLQHTKDTVQKKLKVLQHQRDELHHTRKQVENYVGFVEKTAENVCNEEFISMKNNNITYEIRHLAELFRFTELGLRETANLKVVLPSKNQLNDMCQRSSVFSVYTRSPDSKPVITGQINKITVDIADSDGSAKHSIVAQLLSLVNGSMVHAEILPREGCTFEVSYVPRNRAQHHLSISINDIWVATHSVFVQYPPTFLGHPEQVIEDIQAPRRLAISNNGELYVTERDSNGYVIFDMNNKRMKSVSSYGSNHLIGITVDDDDNVYVTSDHKIQKFNRSGALERILGSDQTGTKSGEFNHPNGIRFHDGHIYVCDSNNGRIQVFDKELTFVKMFGSKEKAQGRFESPLDVDFDSRKNMYVADPKRHSIVIFDKAGAYIRTIGSYGANPGSLSRPTGVCVSGEYVYVVEILVQRVSVFNVNGTFVCSFGSHGHQMGQLNAPVAIAMDKDGYLYVCDTQNNRIQVF